MGGLGAPALPQCFYFLDSAHGAIVETGLRRDNFDPGPDGICRALRRLAGRNGVKIDCPGPFNPNIQEPVRGILGKITPIHLVEPRVCLHFVSLWSRPHLTLTDSGCVRREAPSLGEPVLMMRATTERQEVDESMAIEARNRLPFRYREHKMIGIRANLV